MQTVWNDRFAQRTQRMRSSAIRELLKLTEEPDVISFGGGLPAPDVFPIEEISETCQKVLHQSGAQALQYGATEGYTPLRDLIASHLRRHGLDTQVQNVLITTGSQQALDLVGKIFINRGDHILVESPTYLGALQAWNAYGAEYLCISTDNDGMRTDLLEEAMRSGPKFIYVLPNYQNPTGVTLSLERRKELVRLADQYGVPIIEDDPYGQLLFEGNPLPTIAELDLQYHQASKGGTNVIYLSSYSKILSPGLRLAYIVAPPEVILKCTQGKQGTDLHTPTFNQIVAYELTKGNFFERHIPKICSLYKERRDVMLDALEKYMPEGVHWTHPKGGLFLWVTLPEEMDATELFKVAIQKKVAFVPGDSFHACGGGQNTMRLNFSYCQNEVIIEGIRRLADSIKEF